jgi:uncharacterized membrane protein YcjF (UPF0283 family)
MSEAEAMNRESRQRDARSRQRNAESFQRNAATQATITAELKKEKMKLESELEKKSRIQRIKNSSLVCFLTVLTGFLTISFITSNWETIVTLPQWFPRAGDVCVGTWNGLTGFFSSLHSGLSNTNEVLAWVVSILVGLILLAIVLSVILFVFGVINESYNKGFENESSDIALGNKMALIAIFCCSIVLAISLLSWFPVLCFWHWFTWFLLLWVVVTISFLYLLATN